MATTSPSQIPLPVRWRVERVTASRLNIRFATTQPAMPPAICAAISVVPETLRSIADAVAP